jgi:hypothetical protein
VPKLREAWGDGPIVLKGIQSVEDAKLAIEHGFDGIIVSNVSNTPSEPLGTFLTRNSTVDGRLTGQSPHSMHCKALLRKSKGKPPLVSTVAFVRGQICEKLRLPGD